MQKTQVVKDILKQHNITSWYQPIINVESRELLGWEAFTRGLETNQGLATPAMFDTAAEAGILKPFDLMCMHNAAHCFEQLQLGPKLFINLSNEMLIASSRLKKQVGKMIAKSAIPPTRIVLEVDEKNASHNLSELIEAVGYFHELGFEVAIDHLSKLDNIFEDREIQVLWQELNPDYIKLDRGFIEGLHGSLAKQKSITEIVAIARSLGARLIAEGVETEKELQKLYELGVHNIQGYLIQKPELAPLPPKIDALLENSIFKETNKASLACDLIVYKSHLQLNNLVKEVFDIFEQQVHINSIAVLEDHAVKGVIYRRPFMEKYAKKQRREVIENQICATVMTTNFLKVESHQRIEQVSRLVTSRAQINAEYDFIIENEGRYLGFGTVIDLLKKITYQRVQPGHQENLLTLLPGSTPIQDCVEDLLEQNVPFSAVLLDLSHFKVFNTYYGYLAGDQVLLMFSAILKRHTLNTEHFVGHMGGDDFFLLIKGLEWQEVITRIFEEFQHKILTFYHQRDLDQGGIKVKYLDADSIIEPFISITANIMTVHEEYVESFRQVMSGLIKLKHLTKQGHAPIAQNYHQQISLYTVEEGLLLEVKADLEADKLPN